MLRCTASAWVTVSSSPGFLSVRPEGDLRIGRPDLATQLRVAGLDNQPALREDEAAVGGVDAEIQQHHQTDPALGR